MSADSTTVIAVRGEEQLTRARKPIGPILLVVPALIPLVLVILLPALRTIVMSFHEITYGQEDVFIGFSNYVAMVRDSVFRVAFTHTLLFSFATVSGEILLGFATAVLMSTQFRAQKFYISLIMIPYAVSEVVAVIIWKYMLEPDIGIVNFLLDTGLGLGQIEWATNTVHTWIVIILLRIWVRFPFSFLIIYSSLIGIPRDLYESAYIDGANNWQGLRLITLPLAKPAILVASIFAFVFAFRNFATVWIMTGGGPIHRTELLSTLLYKQAFSYWQFGFASAIAIVMTLLTFLISAYYLRDMFQSMFGKRG